MKANYKTSKRGLRKEAGIIEEAMIDESGNLGMSLYDVNKNFMADQPALSQDELTASLKVIEDYVFNTYKNSTYFMLLCKELSYYTVFVRDSESSTNILTDEVLNCLQWIAKDILSIELNTTNNTPEIWIRTPEEEVVCMYLFNYDNGVIDFGG